MFKCWGMRNWASVETTCTPICLYKSFAKLWASASLTSFGHRRRAVNDKAGSRAQPVQVHGRGGAKGRVRVAASRGERLAPVDEGQGMIAIEFVSMLEGPIG